MLKLSDPNLMVPFSTLSSQAAVADDTAVCLDGSPAAYHLMRGFGSGSDKWIVHLEVINLFPILRIDFPFYIHYRQDR